VPGRSRSRGVLDWRCGVSVGSRCSTLPTLPERSPSIASHRLTLGRAHGACREGDGPACGHRTGPQHVGGEPMRESDGTRAPSAARVRWARVPPHARVCERGNTPSMAHPGVRFVPFPPDRLVETTQCLHVPFGADGLCPPWAKLCRWPSNSSSSHVERRRTTCGDRPWAVRPG